MFMRHWFLKFLAALLKRRLNRKILHASMKKLTNVVNLLLYQILSLSLVDFIQSPLLSEYRKKEMIHSRF
jgi:hypothetical protein